MNNDQIHQALQALDEFKDDEIARQQERVSQERKRKLRKKWRLAGQWACLMVCVGIVLYQLPVLISTTRSEAKPLRHGTYNTDAMTDQCITNLWQISRLLQEGKTPDSNITCPASNQPYVVVREADDIIVRSPHPERYGFKDIRVSLKRPVPELIK
jgi:hypothetical protein